MVRSESPVQFLHAASRNESRPAPFVGKDCRIIGRGTRRFRTFQLGDESFSFYAGVPVPNLRIAGRLIAFYYQYCFPSAAATRSIKGLSDSVSAAAVVEPFLIGIKGREACFRYSCTSASATPASVRCYP